jgi:hypothetical protein
VKEGEYDVARWTDPRYGTKYELTFAGDKLIGHGMEGGTAFLEKAYPRPVRTGLKDWRESIRRELIPPAAAVWILAMFVCWALPRVRVSAAETMIAASLVCGAAWLTSPWYSVTWQGVFANDKLFYALVMFWVGVTILAMCMPSDAVGRPRFQLQTLLGAIAVCGVLLALGPVGYVALGMLVLGLVQFAVVWGFRGTSTKDKAIAGAAGMAEPLAGGSGGGI